LVAGEGVLNGNELAALLAHFKLSKLAQQGDVSCREVAEMIGAENLPPAYGATVPAGIAAKVAEIAGAGEIEVTGRRF
jgi:hypothetical protein